MPVDVLRPAYRRQVPGIEVGAPHGAVCLFVSLQFCFEIQIIESVCYLYHSWRNCSCKHVGF